MDCIKCKKGWCCGKPKCLCTTRNRNNQSAKFLEFLGIPRGSMNMNFPDTVKAIEFLDKEYPGHFHIPYALEHYNTGVRPETHKEMPTPTKARPKNPGKECHFVRGSKGNCLYCNRPYFHWDEFKNECLALTKK